MLDSESGAGTDRSPGLNPEAGLNPRREHGGADQRVKAAAAKPVSGEGVEPTYTMTDIRIKGRAARSESMLLMRRLQSIGRRPVPTKSERPEVEGATTKIKFND